MSNRKPAGDAAAGIVEHWRTISVASYYRDLHNSGLPVAAKTSTRLGRFALPMGERLEMPAEAVQKLTLMFNMDKLQHGRVLWRELEIPGANPAHMLQSGLLWNIVDEEYDEVGDKVFSVAVGCHQPMSGGRAADQYRLAVSTDDKDEFEPGADQLVALLHTNKDGTYDPEEAQIMTHVLMRMLADPALRL